MFYFVKESSNRFILAYTNDFVENNCATIVYTLVLLLFYSSSAYRLVNNNIGLKSFD